MKKALVFVLCALILLPAAALAADAQRGKQEAYSGPRARISVTEIRDRSARGGISAQMLEKYNIPWKEIGEGMREMLVTALFRTKRFAVLERALIEEILKEQDLGASGRVQGGTEAGSGGILGYCI